MNDRTAWQRSGAKEAAGRTIVITDGGYQGTGLLIPHRRQPGQAQFLDWKQEHNACRLKGDGVHYAVLGIARLHSLALAR
jgi:hypothetical protein